MGRRFVKGAAKRPRGVRKGGAQVSCTERPSPPSLLKRPWRPRLPATPSGPRQPPKFCLKLILASQDLAPLHTSPGAS